MTIPAFQKYILTWYDKNKRDWLPWRQTRDPYHILVSEVMLQQTQVSRVLQKYPEFLNVFPTIGSLAKASLRKILMVWQGMGYNRRGVYLKRIALEVMKRYGGKIPSDPKKLQTLPGIGPYTACAIACFAFAKPVVFLDTNIRKVYLSHLFDGRQKDGIKMPDSKLLEMARESLYKKDPRKWHYALMDYGAMVLRKERGILERFQGYHKQSPFEGSSRYFRSKILRNILINKKTEEKEIIAYLQNDSLFSSKIDIPRLFWNLEKEKFIKKDKNNFYSLC